MKRAIVLAIFALFVIAACVSADTATATVKTGYNLLSASLVPYEPAPSLVFKTDTGASINILSNRLFRYDTAAGSYKYYSTAFGGSAFGKVLMGMGMFLKNDSGANIIWQYVGCPNGVPDSLGTKTDMWISLASAGYNMIGCPFTDVAGIVWANCKMTDGNETVSVTDAKNIKGWWTGNLQFFNNTSGSYQNVVLSGLGQKNLMPYTGYLLKTTQPNLALIIPHL